ncbi:MAG TPA: hypothetical protein VF587_03790 [Solirubrobacteraceae bacterium]
MTAADLRISLQRLETERAAATSSPLSDNALYMDDLEADLEAAREAYVGLAVTELATLRAELSGPQRG